jgi:predicted secreted Zn-dependent protease
MILPILKKHTPTLAIVLFTALALPAFAIADPIVTTQMNYYDVTGNTVTELNSSMRRESRLHNPTGPNYSALTNHKIRWRYKFRKNADSCAIDTVTTNVALTLMFPRLREDATTPAEARAKFLLYTKNLLTHEMGHADIGIAIATEIEQGIRNLPPAPTCDALKTIANTLGKNLLAQGKQRNIAYDARTDHGHTQGARFP